MPSSYIEKRLGRRGKRYRAVLEWRESGKPKRHKDPWTRYWAKANQRKQTLMSEAEDIRLGIKKPRSRHSWSELTQRWTASRSGRAANTRRWWDQPMINDAAAFWGNPDLSEITPEKCSDLREWLKKRPALIGRRGKEPVPSGKPYSETTVKMRLQALKTILFYAKDELEWIDRNPMSKVEIPAGRDSERTYLNDEFQKLLAAAEEGLKGPLWMAALRAVRRGELLMMDKRMLWKDEDGDYWVRLRKPARFGIRSAGELKTRRKGERDVHIPAESIPYMDLQGAAGPLFPGLTTCTLRKMWERARKTAQLPPPHRWHDWKHTAVTKLLEQGYTLLDVQRLTGNTLDSLQRYAHIGARFQKGLAARISYNVPPQSPPQEPGKSAQKKGGKLKSPSRKRFGALGVEPRTSWSQSGGPDNHPPTEICRFHVCPTCGQTVMTGEGRRAHERLDYPSYPNSTPE